jgi:hypothetical protein
MERKQIIHIASEVVVISGLAIYFKLKTNSLSETIEKLKEQLETQDEMIVQLESKANSLEKLLHKHDQLISSLLFAKSKPKQSQHVEEYQYSPQRPQKTVSKLEKNRHSTIRREVPREEKRELPSTREEKREVHPKREERREVPPTPPPSREEESSGEDLDEQILNELNELNNMSPVNEYHKSESDEDCDDIIEIDTSLKKKA